MEVLINGGWVMVALLGLSITSLAIVLQKLLLIRKTTLKPNFLQLIKTKLSTHTKENLINELRESRRISGKIAAKTIEKFGATEAVIHAEIFDLTKEDITNLTSKMNLLSMIITAAPILGLLGTVLGLMDVFAVIAVEGSVQAELLSAGISKALVTTVTGLSLALPLMFVHQFMTEKIEDRLDEWDNIPVQLIAYMSDLG